MSFHPDLILPGDIDAYRLVIGGLLFWFPGLIWTWALTPNLAWAYRVPLSIVAAFTIQPATMLLLGFFLRVPVNLTTTALLSVALGLAGIILLLRRLEPLWDPERSAPQKAGPATPPHPSPRSNGPPGSSEPPEPGPDDRS